MVYKILVNTYGWHLGLALFNIGLGTIIGVLGQWDIFPSNYYLAVLFALLSLVGYRKAKEEQL